MRKKRNERRTKRKRRRMKRLLILESDERRAERRERLHQRPLRKGQEGVSKMMKMNTNWRKTMIVMRCTKKMTKMTVC